MTSSHSCSSVFSFVFMTSPTSFCSVFYFRFLFKEVTNEILECLCFDICPHYSDKKNERRLKQLKRVRDKKAKRVRQKQRKRVSQKQLKRARQNQLKRIRDKQLKRVHRKQLKWQQLALPQHTLRAVNVWFC